jgi:NADP-dependent alcohol dehydrogenase
VYGEALRAEIAAHVPAATDTLPPALVAEGILEALLRLTACYVGSLRDLPRQDEFVERYAVRLVGLGDEVRIARDARMPVSPDLRLAAARISGASHAQEVVADRDQYSDIPWPLANELSMAAGTRKLTALAAVTPQVWRRITAGDERLGSARRLARLWALLRRSTRADLGPEPAAGLAALVDHWRIDREVGASFVDAGPLARDAAHAWGRGLPMLKGLSVEEVRAIYAEALTLRTDDLSARTPERRECNV